MISPSYLAFKALEGADGRLISPQQCTPWAIDSQGRPTLVAAPGDVDRGRGIYASAWKIAEEYGGDLYLCSPSAEGAEDDVVLGDEGWRSSAATVVGGPYARSEAGKRQAAEIVLAAWHQGYPQVGSILKWAALLLYDAEAAIEVCNGHELYRAGLYWPDERWSPAIAEALARSGDSHELYTAGRDWRKSRWSPAIAEALARAGDSHVLRLAGRYWPDARWSPAITDALARSGNGHELYRAGCEWPDERWSPAIAEALARSGAGDALYSAGRYWPDKRWTPAIARRLQEVADADTLRQAVTFWRPERARALE